MTRYYKTTDPTALALLQERDDAVRTLRAEGEAFRATFGAKHVLTSNSLAEGFRIRGLEFEPQMPAPLWTKPDARACGAQKPRASLKAGSPEHRAALKELQRDWEVALPKGSVSWKPVLAALGTDWSASFFSSFSLFEHDGAIYIKTGTKLAEHCVEILGSEYDAAREAFTAQKVLP